MAELNDAQVADRELLKRAAGGIVPVNLRFRGGAPTQRSLQEFIESAKLSPKKARRVRAAFGLKP
jgi:hypothetical protein